jgi:hypothetical protein
MLADTRQQLDARQAAINKTIDQISSPKLETLDQQLAAMKVELDALPAEKKSATLGYHSAIVRRQDETKWVQVDLGASMPIEDVVLVPAHVAYGGHAGPGFGFPVRYKVEVSDTPDFAAPRTLADHTASNFPHPGDEPVHVAAGGITGRYVRVTATKLWERTKDWIFALAELQVRDASHNVARGKPVTSLDSIEAAPSWARTNLVDGYNSLHELASDGASALSPRGAIEEKISSARNARRKLVDDRMDDSTRAALIEGKRALADVESQSSALPPQRFVYAAVSNFKPQGGFAPPRGPRPIHRFVDSVVQRQAPDDQSNKPELTPAYQAEKPATQQHPPTM